MKGIVVMLTGIMLLLAGIFLLLLGAWGVAVFAAIAGVIAFVLGAVEALFGGVETRDIAPSYGRIAQKTCPGCGEKHDIDYPKCPYCDYHYNE